jgi:hypothetical protein
MGTRKANLHVICLAAGATALGLAGLGVAALGRVGVCLPSLLLLAVGTRGLLAGAIQWRVQRAEGDREANAQLGRAHAELEGGNAAAAASAASKALAAAETARTRNQALNALAWAALGQGFPERAKAELDRVAPSHAVDLFCLAAVEAARGRTEVAIQALEVMWASRALSRESAKLFVECNLRAFGIERAVMVALQTRKVLGRENCELVVNAARLAGADVAAGKLADALRIEVAEGPVAGKTPALGSASAR